MLSLITLLPACAGPGPAHTSQSASVVQAYNTPGMVAIPRYTRTIFSSTDF